MNSVGLAVEVEEAELTGCQPCKKLATSIPIESRSAGVRDKRSMTAADYKMARRFNN